jgi:hypothetical protein
MMAARPFRWLLSLLAMFAPVAATACRAADAQADSTVQRASDDHVVFRHYLLGARPPGRARRAHQGVRGAPRCVRKSKSQPSGACVTVRR